MVTFTKSQTALFLSDGDFWWAVSNTGNLDEVLGDLITTADNTEPDNLYGTMPDDSVVNIGTSPRRPRKP